ncbi:MAG: peptidylprolyl isomerase [Treponema sp.]|jgi:FKBP-type peptidyl-prolyl cis-trans isomerase SlyD|nr:peptidylprolyl isomerase [Treponema sp.]
MNIAKDRVVSFDYTLTGENNEQLDSSSGGEPLAYLHGYQNIIPGLEKALEGRAEGDRFQVKIPAAEAYGERDEGQVLRVPRDRFNGIDAIKTGMQFEAQTPQGNRIVRVTALDGDTVTVDGNHPLAGQALSFDVTVRGIREAAPEEISHGHPHHAQDCDCESSDCKSSDCSGCHER